MVEKAGHCEKVHAVVVEDPFDLSRVARADELVVRVGDLASRDIVFPIGVPEVPLDRPELAVG